MEEINIQKAWQTIFKIHRSNYASLEKVEEMEHKFKVGDFVETTIHGYLFTRPGVKCKIVNFIDNETMEVEIVGQEEEGLRWLRWVEIKDFRRWEEPEEFEPITRDNIVEVLEYNGFNYLKSTGVEHVLDKDIVITNVGIKVPYAQVTFENPNWLKHLELYTGNLKPLPKKPVFDPKQFLVDNGFKIEEGLIITYKGICFGKFSLDEKELYFGKNEYALTKENLQKVVDAAKLLEGME